MPLRPCYPPVKSHHPPSNDDLHTKTLPPSDGYLYTETLPPSSDDIQAETPRTTGNDLQLQPRPPIGELPQCQPSSCFLISEPTICWLFIPHGVSSHQRLMITSDLSPIHPAAMPSSLSTHHQLYRPQKPCYIGCQRGTLAASSWCHILKPKWCASFYEGATPSVKTWITVHVSVDISAQVHSSQLPNDHELWDYLPKSGSVVQQV